MKKNVFISLAVMFLLSSCCEQSHLKPICYENNVFIFQIDKRGDTICDFKVSNKNTGDKIHGKASLIVIDGVVPECGLVEDYENPNDIAGFQCDSTYFYIDSNLNVSFAFEINNRERIDFEIWQSTIKGFSVGGYTLRRIETDNDVNNTP